ncbi:MAG: phycobilisome rod-core linker polypeptide [Roseofilum sp. SBFL]|uniref:phycobilisome rod-core linker polypeptide n=1 Tax=unclassified Roseofilum TaxID=2620099 RepID=UPI001B0A5F84|nr:MULTISPECIES: phycobilisome rod-core linker polypeptide [unclassified Roseofilum]MBP0012957.1 phycobilisome rod-core linker polypeptide [Roseofilum sp. SID3]MBP0023369.1 phycobilisome rod-core linker polypeptide [Roseofilum sp. SID2]MBP0036583.1 phycobilisome rod-core linker polypeptide [Roseofilum sp. SID1]MBP0040544.1 phycobilisome rod-core linker polypeptide [Roseofilum sp. SBFL]
MNLPLLTYPLSSQNQRVKNYEIPGDEQPRIYSAENLPKGTEIDEIIWAGYRQVFNEQQMIAFNRQPALESQFRHGEITVRGFMRGLALSDSFRRLNYDTNNNYRFVEMCIQRFLGREVYNPQEKLAWSIVLATKGLRGFIDQLLDTEEYEENFGDDIVPYQRRRILPQRSQGDLPFARMARYDTYYLKQLRRLGLLRTFGNGVQDRSAAVYRRVLLIVPALAVVILITTLIFIAAPQ